MTDKERDMYLKPLDCVNASGFCVRACVYVCVCACVCVCVRACVRACVVFHSKKGCILTRNTCIYLEITIGTSNMT